MVGQVIDDRGLPVVQIDPVHRTSSLMCTRTRRDFFKFRQVGVHVPAHVVEIPKRRDGARLTVGEPHPLELTLEAVRRSGSSRVLSIEIHMGEADDPCGQDTVNFDDHGLGQLLAEEMHVRAAMPWAM